jgi:hypothetical protein
MWNNLYFIEKSFEQHRAELKRNMDHKYVIPKPKARYRTLFMVGGWFTMIGQLLETRYEAQATCC